MRTNDRDVARTVLAREWVTEEQLKEALFQQIVDPSATDGRRHPRPLLATLLSRGLITTQQAAEIEDICGDPGSTGGGDDSAVSFSPPREVVVASGAARNLYGHLVRVESIGHGGMGEVWRAWDINLRRWVAMKFVNQSHRHLLKEARSAARLSHPNIVPIYEVTGEESEEPYFVMKHVEGGTLLDRIGTLTARTSAELMMAVADAIHYAHQQGVVHRDLKPQNILIEADGRPVVTDFGLARSLEHAASGTPGEAAGTPAYMSPEQARGGEESIGPWVDVYGIGATLYHLLTGRPPYQGKTNEVILDQVRREPPPTPQTLNPEVHPDLERIVLRAMERDVQRRYPLAENVARDLDRFLRREPILGEGEEAFSEAVSLLEAGRLKEGVMRMRETLRLPWAPGVAESSETLILRQLEENESAVSIALESRPNYTVALRHRGCLRTARAVVLGLLGKPLKDELEAATEDLRKAVTLSSGDAQLLLLRASVGVFRARFWKQLGTDPVRELEGALSNQDHAIAASPTAAALHGRAVVNIALARHLHQAGEDARAAYASAIEDMERAARLEPDNNLLLQDLAMAYLGRARRRLGRRKQDWEAARRCLERAIERQADHAAASLLRKRLRELGGEERASVDAEAAPAAEGEPAPISGEDLA